MDAQPVDLFRQVRRALQDRGLPDDMSADDADYCGTLSETTFMIVYPSLAKEATRAQD